VWAGESDPWKRKGPSKRGVQSERKREIRGDIYGRTGRGGGRSSERPQWNSGNQLSRREKGRLEIEKRKGLFSEKERGVTRVKDNSGRGEAIEEVEGMASGMLFHRSRGGNLRIDASHHGYGEEASSE